MRLKMIGFFVAAFCLFAVPSFAADVTGTYEGEMAMPKMQGGGGGGGGGMGPQGPMKYTFTLKQDGAKLSGSVKSPFPGPANEFTDGKIEGDKISIAYEVDAMGNKMKIKWDGVVKGDEITFTMGFEGGMGGGPGGGEMPPMKVVVKKQK
jgi:hypothetical protein